RTPFRSLELRKPARSSFSADASRSRLALSVAGVTSMSSVTTGAPATRAAAAPIRTNRTRWRSRVARIFSGSGSGTTWLRCQRAKLPARQQPTPQPFGRGAAQLALNQDLVVVALIDLGQPDAELEASGLDQRAQP